MSYTKQPKECDGHAERESSRELLEAGPRESGFQRGLGGQATLTFDLTLDSV